MPTLVIHRLQDRITPPCHGRYLASHNANVHYGLVHASFAAPGQAVSCAAAIRAESVGRGAEVRAAIHTTLEVANRIAALARPDEILVSRAVMDLTVGGGLEFADRGTYQFAGIAGDWPVFALVQFSHSPRDQ